MSKSLEEEKAARLAKEKEQAEERSRRAESRTLQENSALRVSNDNGKASGSKALLEALTKALDSRDGKTARHLIDNFNSSYGDMIHMEYDGYKPPEQSGSVLDAARVNPVEAILNQVSAPGSTLTTVNQSTIPEATHVNDRVLNGESNAVSNEVQPSSKEGGKLEKNGKAKKKAKKQEIPSDDSPSSDSDDSNRKKRKPRKKQAKSKKKRLASSSSSSSDDSGGKRGGFKKPYVKKNYSFNRNDSQAGNNTAGPVQSTSYKPNYFNKGQKAGNAKASTQEGNQAT
ncbi:uncharacterized protein MELLADRAFT_64026 [Melampsora larici-populina 98AG31]|uniref:Uncharacterized protein n=1 Tax=Melampsora larici-populina (strain 98AG31 / pathotype 3-4-7) TaxID=747676 RepID=F4RPX1_MELLP|nr:uncharacterized protein MELLADRAFT_64026 [Melampsora larici-populina 98AG31]EGG05621.1 hypothetical protein MELLADRAFT_64026 [Melampsora larici-populina 98AG31]